MGTLECRKCHVMLTDRIAQQSQDDIEATLSARNSSIDTHRKAMNSGPLCDRCLSRWQERYRRKVAAQDPDTRSPAIRALDEACQRLMSVDGTAV